jgi:hypothetical protein
MKRLMIGGAFFTTLICFVYLFFSPRSKYEWMSDFDPEISVAAIEDGSGNRVVAGGVAVLLIWLCQALFAWQSKSARHSMLALSFSALAAIVWYFRFG